MSQEKSMERLKFIVITDPHEVRDEERLCVLLLESGIDVLHLRKPGWDIGETERFICSICEWKARKGGNVREVMRRIVVHDHFSLADKYGLGGIHINKRNKLAERGNGTLSASCHSMEEAERRKPQCDYIFLSPIFDSISKKGYLSAFSRRDLIRARRKGIIDMKVMALGGVKLRNIPFIRSMGFGGAAFLGDLWRFSDYPETLKSHAERIRRELDKDLG